jgi:hypothetical protein
VKPAKSGGSFLKSEMLDQVYKTLTTKKKSTQKKGEEVKPVKLSEADRANQAAAA